MQETEGLSYQVFMRTQYDILRRLRSYWLPRFIIHHNQHPKFKQSLATGKKIASYTIHIDLGTDGLGLDLFDGPQQVTGISTNKWLNRMFGYQPADWANPTNRLIQLCQ